jgi:hypothetical protein
MSLPTGDELAFGVLTCPGPIETLQFKAQVMRGEPIRNQFHLREKAEAGSPQG